MLLSTAFCPPAEYFALFSRGPVILDDREHYQKQSWRNRLRYLAADGIHDFSIPVVHPRAGSGSESFSGASSEFRAGDNSEFHAGAHCTPITEIRVDYSTPWVRNLRRALTTAYSSAAYFDHYAPDFFAILESRPDRLWDLNLGTLRFLAQALRCPAPQSKKSTFIPSIEPRPISGELLNRPDQANNLRGELLDMRGAIHPKHPLPPDIPPIGPYFQVFSDRMPFTPGLSAIDLIFNEGPEAASFLLQNQPTP